MSSIILADPVALFVAVMGEYALFVEFSDQEENIRYRPKKARITIKKIPKSLTRGSLKKDSHLN